MGTEMISNLPAQLTCPICHTVFVTRFSNESETYHGQPPSPLTKAAIYDAQDLQRLPDPYTKLPSLRSWASFRDSKSTNEKGNSQKTRTNPDKSQMRPRTRTHIDSKSAHQAAHHDNTVSAIKARSFPKSADARRDYDATVSPSLPYIIKSPDPNLKGISIGKAQKKYVATSKANRVRFPKNKGQSTQIGMKLTKMYQNLRGMHNSTSIGEGNALLEGMKVFHRESQEYRLKKQPLEHNFSNPRTPPPPPTMALAVHPALRHPPAPVHGNYIEVVNMPKRQHSRQDSVMSDGQVSLSSCEVPIGISIRHVGVNLDKPLPPLPQIHPTPKSRQKPATKSIEPEETHTCVSLVGTASLGIQYPTQWLGTQDDTQAHGHERTAKDTSTSLWWNTVASNNHLNSDTDTQTKAHSALKAKISNPGPLMATNNGQTVNIAIECGGAGGPAAAISLPVARNGVPLPPRSQTQAQRPLPLRRERLDNRQKSKHRMVLDTKLASSKHWRDKLTGHVDKSLAGTRRPDSDVSFVCQGLQYSSFDTYPQQPVRLDVDFQDLGSLMQRQTSEIYGLDTCDEEIVPKPLFSAKEHERDTRFYQPFHDVLREYHG